MAALLRNEVLHKLYNVDNLKLRRFREVFGAEWRNDRRDAKMRNPSVKGAVI